MNKAFYKQQHWCLSS